MGYHTQLAAHCSRLARQAEARYAHFPHGLPREGCQDAQKRSLAGSIRPQQGYKLTLVNAEIQVPQDGLGTKTLHQVMHYDNWRHSTPALCRQKRPQPAVVSARPDAGGKPVPVCRRFGTGRPGQ